ncbi:DUF4439 domain-containing protein [Arthrobacter sp. fls2-241-R2A-200]|uniref:DUF4439 domain-containing protein n=1 Tax=Arthrobacter sp. fls2-241-R2A-200 TaxID=3040281 RepID=UPI00254A3367|nr:DUF4439 domain-containing protein [Arthrobacter sp. fls2-241-R2A-200]
MALLVLGTGMVLVPRESAAPAPLSFSATARISALTDAVRLRESSARLALTGSPAGGGSDAKEVALKDVVTLLTTHASALLGPDGDLPDGVKPDGRSPSGASTGTATGPGAPAATTADLVSDLAASGRRRMDDARKADGGIARLLAAVGSAQLLESGKLATLWQLPAPSLAPSSSTSLSTAASNEPSSSPAAIASCPSATPPPESAHASTAAALAASVAAGHRAVYLYQVALKRLGGADASSAAKGLQDHESQLKQAEDLTRAECTEVPMPEAGYRLDAGFSRDPAASLGALEIGSLAVWGDLVALSSGPARDWALENLLETARRGQQWGAALPELPGINLQPGSLPTLPTTSASPSR